MAISSTTGLISGIDYQSMISQIMEIEKRPVSQLSATISTYQNQQSALGSMKSALETLKNKAAELYKETNFISRVANSSNAEILSVTASTTAAVGNYSIKVNQLAQSDRKASQGFADTDTTAVAAGSGAFTFQIGENGTVYSVDVDATTTLNDLRDKINAETTNVRASIINDGSQFNPYRLVLTSASTGESQSINILTNNTTLEFSQKYIEEAQASTKNTFDGTVTSNSGTGGYTGTTSKRYVVEMTTGGAIGDAKFRVSEDGGLTWSADDAFTTSNLPTSIFKTSDEGVKISFGAGTTNFSVGDRFTIDAFAPQLQEAKDAYIEIDGVQINRATNNIDDALEGVSLNLNKVDSSETVNISISNNDQNVQGLILQFVQAYNAAIKNISELTKYDPDSGEKGILLGDSTARSAKNSLMSIVTTVIPGLSTGLNSLAQIGITTNKTTGLLETNTSTLKDAIDDNYEDVKKLFAAMGTSSTSKIEYVESPDKALFGSFDVTITEAAAQAAISGNQGISVAGITNSEVLTFTKDGKDISVSLNAGDKLVDIIEKINNKMTDYNMGIRAFAASGNKLELRTVEYGKEETFKVVSDQDGGVNTQTGIGTTLREATGTDVAGTINGMATKGYGQNLIGATGTSIEGLKLKITATTTGNIGKLNLTQGVADQVNRLIDTYTNSENGLIKARTDGLSDTIEQIQVRIESYTIRLEERQTLLQTKFSKLEAILSQYQSQSQYLSSTLAMINTK